MRLFELKNLVKWKTLADNSSHLVLDLTVPSQPEAAPQISDSALTAADQRPEGGLPSFVCARCEQAIFAQQFQPPSSV